MRKLVLFCLCFTKWHSRERKPAEDLQPTGFDPPASGRLVEIRNCDVHPDTLLGNFTIPGNKDYEFMYRLSEKNGETRVVPMRLQEFELDSICIVY